MNKTTTALTDAIEAINKDIRHYASQLINMPKSEAEKWKAKLQVANKHKTLLISLLPKEREDMEEAYTRGCINEYQPKSAQMTRSQYFNKSFTQYKTKDNALTLLDNEWVRVDSGVLPLYDNNGITTSPKVLVYDGTQKMGWYFPDKFKTVEFEDWDDFKEDDYPYMENDTEKGCVWLRAGWYELLDHPTDDYCYYKPIKAKYWRNMLPSPPKEK